MIALSRLENLLSGLEMESLSSFGGSYHASVSCASNEEESAFLKRARLLRWIRLGLSAVIFSVSVSIIGCEAVPLLHYRRTSAFERFWLFLWPLNFDLRPTIALLACGCVIAFQTVLYIVTTLLPSVSLAQLCCVSHVQDTCSNTICSLARIYEA